MKKIITTISLLVLLTSCNQENYLIDSSNTNQRVTPFDEYLSFFDPQTEAHILLQSSTAISADNNIWNINSSIKGDKQPYDFIVDNRLFTSEDVYRSDIFSNWRISNEDLSSIYGRRLRLEKYENTIRASNANNNFSDNDIYIPKLLTAQVNYLQSNSVAVGTKLTWNKDDLNTRGVIITMEYKPLDQKVQEIATTYSMPIMRGDTMPDTGEYTVTASDLSAFPDGATISFHLGRAGFTIINNENQNVEYSVGAYTVIRGDYTIKK